MQRRSERGGAGGESGRSSARRLAPACRGAHAAGIPGSDRLSCRIPLDPGKARKKMFSGSRNTGREPGGHAGQGRGFSSVGPPASFQAPKPPAMWATGASPMFCAACVASAERMPPAQKKTNFLPLAKKGL